MAANYRIRMKADKKTGEILIYDYIGYGAISADQFAKELKALGDVSLLNIRINSGGGDVFDGLAIYNTLRRHPAQKNVSIDGAALSIASIVAMAGDTIAMAENAMFMVHNPWSIMSGTEEDFRAQADVMRDVKENLISTYERRVTQSLGAGNRGERIRKLMAAETWLRGPAAMAEGFVDEVTTDLAIKAYVDLTRFKNVPPDLRAQLQNTTSTPRSDLVRAKLREMTERATRI